MARLGLTLALLILPSLVLADEVRVIVEQASEVVISTDATGRITVLVRPKGPVPPGPSPIPPRPDDPTPDPAPNLDGLAKVAWDAARPVNRPAEAGKLANLYAATAAKIAAGAGDIQSNLTALGQQSKDTLGNSYAAWLDALKAISGALRDSGATTPSDVAAGLRDVSRGLQAVANAG